MVKIQQKSVEYSELIKKVFEVKDGRFLIGGEEINKELLDVLQEQSRYISTSQLYEVLIATLKNEAVTLPLVSENMEQVQFAKALWHVAYIIEAMIITLKSK